MKLDEEEKDFISFLLYRLCEPESFISECKLLSENGKQRHLNTLAQNTIISLCDKFGVDAKINTDQYCPICFNKITDNSESNYFKTICPFCGYIFEEEYNEI